MGYRKGERSSSSIQYCWQPCTSHRRLWGERIYVELRCLECGSLRASTVHQNGTLRLSMTLGQGGSVSAGVCLPCICRCMSSWFQKSSCSLLHLVQNYFKFLALRIDAKVQRNPLIWRNNESCAFLFQQLFEALRLQGFLSSSLLH